MLTASLMTGMRLVLFDDVRSGDVARAHGRPRRDRARRARCRSSSPTSTPSAVTETIRCSRSCGRSPVVVRPRHPRSAAWRARCWACAASPTRGASPSSRSPRTGMPDAPLEILDTTTGPAMPGVEVRAVTDDERVCAPGEEGELRLRGPQCFLGYVDASLDAAAFDDDGWFRTGDLGIIDADGNVTITGRIKDIIIRNAENISALEIEDALYQPSCGHRRRGRRGTRSAHRRARVRVRGAGARRGPRRRCSRSPSTAAASGSRCRSAPSSSSSSTCCRATPTARCSSRSCASAWRESRSHHRTSAGRRANSSSMSSASSREGGAVEPASQRALVQREGDDRERRARRRRRRARRDDARSLRSR